MARENAQEKGRRYLGEGRLVVERVEPGYETGLPAPHEHGTLIVATCRGGGEEYKLGYDPKAREWRCTCPAKGECAHLHALKLVTRLNGGSSG